MFAYNLQYKMWVLYIKWLFSQMTEQLGARCSISRDETEVKFTMYYYPRVCIDFFSLFYYRSIQAMVTNLYTLQIISTREEWMSSALGQYIYFFLNFNVDGSCVWNYSAVWHSPALHNINKKPSRGWCHVCVT